MRLLPGLQREEQGRPGPDALKTPDIKNKDEAGVKYVGYAKIIRRVVLNVCDLAKRKPKVPSVHAEAVWKGEAGLSGASRRRVGRGCRSGTRRGASPWRIYLPLG